ncbi:TRAP transporter substrate-binding protein DctP [Bacillus dakarensis]|uniref:TRAP transporter substrate-binding protein DctP n=1 Tax=Robertmurraya dakarensis TaxID=1926278 RepID=UPI000980A761|nr:TRAP transporter substrate-binding protein DctP [Bacillus dakarensis]
MSRFKSLFFISLSFVLLLVTAGCVEKSSPSTSNSTTPADGGAEEEETIVLRASSGLPDHQVWMKSIIFPWIERVEKETNGRVKFDVFTGGELVTLGQEYDALKAGTIDVALPIMPLYDPSRFPLSEVTMLPLVESDPKVMNEAFSKLIYGDYPIKDGKTFSELEYNSNGLKTWAMTGGNAYVISTTELDFDSAEDFKGARIRTGARLSELFINNIGASPISMPQTDAYDALSRGTIDGNLLSVSDWLGWGYTDLFKYTLTGANIGHFSAVFGMLEEKWNTIPADIQEIMETAAREIQISEEARAVMTEEYNNVMEAVEGKVKFETVDELEPDGKELVVGAMEKTWYDWIELMEEAGQPGKETAILWRDLVVEAGGKVPDAIMELE